MQREAAGTEWIVEVLIAADTIAVEGNAKIVNAELGLGGRAHHHRRTAAPRFVE